MYAKNENYPVLISIYSGSNLLYLAVLHPHLLSVYSVVMETSTDLEPTYSLLMNFSHRLKRTASNMVWGEFEGVEGNFKFLSPPSDSLLQ